MAVNLEYMRDKYPSSLLQICVLDLVNSAELYADEENMSARLKRYVEDFLGATHIEVEASVEASMPSCPSHHHNNTFFTLQCQHAKSWLRRKGYICSENCITEKGKFYLEDKRHIVDNIVDNIVENEVVTKVESEPKVEVTAEVTAEVTDQFELIKRYVKLGILRLEDTDALLVRAMSNDITNEERDFLRKVYVDEIQ